MSGCLLFLLAVGFAKYTGPNMNGDVYRLATTPGADPEAFNFPLNYKDRPAKDDVQFVDLYSGPISTRYGEVYLRDSEETYFPDEMREKYKDKIIAIYGMEYDQVYRTDAGDISVPQTVSYDHHTAIVVSGREAEPETTRRRTDSHSKVDRGIDPESWKAAKNGDWSWIADRYLWTFGGESRRTPYTSAPGFPMPNGFIRSPSSFHFEAMLIDTWNRDEMDKYVGVPFVPGPYPSDISGPLGYSGLLECPSTTRITREYEGEWSLEASGGECEDMPFSEDECFYAATQVLPDMGRINKTWGGVDDESLPPGCIVTVDNDVAIVAWNKAESTVKCEDGGTSWACICAVDPPELGQGMGSFVYNADYDGEAYNASYPYEQSPCPAWPTTTLLNTTNPSCDFRTYTGGRYVCGDKYFLLDADQEIPWPDSYLTREVKIRLWFSELQPDYHQPLNMYFYPLGLQESEDPSLELTVCKAEDYDATPVCSEDERGFMVTSEAGLCRREEDDAMLQITEGLMYVEPGELVEHAQAIGAHYHAASGISMEMYYWDEVNDRVDDLICIAKAVKGQGRPGVFADEPNMIMIENCMFSDDPRWGLDSPPLLSGKHLYFRKISNATYDHSGEMGYFYVVTQYSWPEGVDVSDEAIMAEPESFGEFLLIVLAILGGLFAVVALAGKFLCRACGSPEYAQFETTLEGVDVPATYETTTHDGAAVNAKYSLN